MNARLKSRVDTVHEHLLNIKQQIQTYLAQTEHADNAENLADYIFIQFIDLFGGQIIYIPSRKGKLFPHLMAKFKQKVMELDIISEPHIINISSIFEETIIRYFSHENLYFPTRKHFTSMKLKSGVIDLYFRQRKSISEIREKYPSSMAHIYSIIKEYREENKRKSR